MKYTVKKLAGISGVSVRTLRFYDQTGLLKPAYYGANGYRFYEEPELLMLQQILFYRELGFELKQIKRILGRNDFEKVAALKSHRKLLRQNLTRTSALIVTINNTIKHLTEKTKMKGEQFFVGFTPEKQAQHEQYLIDRFGEGMGETLGESKAKVKNWVTSDWERAGSEFVQICRDLVAAKQNQRAADSAAVQSIIRRHYVWLKQFWTPNRVSYAGHSHLIIDSELRKAYEAHDPQLPEYAASAMQVFAEKELS